MMNLVVQNAMAKPELPATIRIVREGDALIAYATELDVDLPGEDRATWAWPFTVMALSSQDAPSSDLRAR